ncbi:MAG TPA: HD domain-containing phosphohydrolase [Vicinamibacteria bacterium]|nr:HD domain-containing phosphohydrolase [Vicinamibacteria bacterium]
MHPILLWTTEPGSLSPEDYSEVFDSFCVRRIQELDARAFGVLLIDEELLHRHHEAVRAFAARTAGVVLPVIALSADPGSCELDELLFDLVPRNPGQRELRRKLNSATRFLDNQLSLEASQTAAQQKARQLEELHEIGIALSAEHDHERLLNLILGKAREITSADAGSLFLVSSLDELVPLPEGRAKRFTGRWLRFRLAQNDSRELEFEEDILTIGPDSIAGYVALTGETLNIPDAYDLPADKPFAINRSFDEAIGYRTRSVLVVPMQNRERETTGVLQLINKKRSRHLRLEGRATFDDEVLPFDEDDERLVRSLASQAAVSIENNRFHLGQEHLFRRFVDAAVKAIESRDSTTKGHSWRVATMTTELARVVNLSGRGSYANLRLSSDQMRELKYAALLHDFGKVGVRERVLIKATKLYHGELSTVRQRFKTIRRALEAQYLRRALDGLLAGEATPEQIEQTKEELRKRLALVDEAREAVEAANKPNVVRFSDFDRLIELGQLCYEDVDGSIQTFLEPDEITALTIARGSLTESEYRMIMSHVDHTYDFLSTIPWTPDLKGVPDLARSHHEKLDGSGYPLRLPAEDIPPQTRMMTISDIYDALTARDRPYKPAVPTERALTILESEASSGKIDRELLDLFIEAKIYELGVKN